ncbi:MAG: hypothetical protein NTV33_09335, partial [Coprothermobacterota bacterium]|nr:hypothetical protein [Coprothermobacterota bacterium]
INKSVPFLPYSPIDDWGEKEWLHAATRNPALDFLKEAEEDIYLLSDGKPYHDEEVSCSRSISLR